MDLVDFLRARLAEDEAVARRAPDIDNAEPLFVIEGDEFVHLGINVSRVLAEVGAKRRLIRLHSAKSGQHPDFCWHDKHERPCPTLRLLALPYADHPDYDDEWL